MGEVKSTIDLIMEKTRGMTLTPDEKRMARHETIKRKVRGLITPYLRGEESLDRLYRSLSEEMLVPAAETLAESLEIEADNGRALEGLRALVSKEPELESLVDEIQAILAEHEALLSRERSQLEIDLLQKLARWGISGSAVKPVVNADPRWHDRIKKLEETYGSRLKEAAGHLVITWERTRSESPRNSGG
jgi:hypothetical protein